MSLLEAGGLALEIAQRSGNTWFGRASHLFILRHIDFRIDAGECVGIVGESGSGKTSLVRTLVRLLEPSQGKLIFDGRDITHLEQQELRPLRAQLQCVFQDSLSCFNPRHRIGRILTQPLLAHGRFEGATQSLEQAAMLLDRVRLPRTYLDRYPHELSGGERQRVGIARALVLDPKLIVADEVLSGLDATTRTQICELLREIKMQTALVLVSHDLAAVQALCDRVYVMYKGEIAESGRTEKIFRMPLHSHTRSLLDAVPSPLVDSAWLLGDPMTQAK